MIVLVVEWLPYCMQYLLNNCRQFVVVVEAGLHRLVDHATLALRLLILFVCFNLVTL